MKIHISKYKIIICVVMFIQFILLVFGLIIPYINGKFIDFLAFYPNKKDIIYFSILYLVVGLIFALFTYINQILSSKLISQVSYEFRLSTFKHMMKIPLKKLKEYDSTYLNQRIEEDCNNIVSFIHNNFLTACFNLISMVIILLILLNINPIVFIFSILFIPLYTFIYLLFKKKLYDRNMQLKEISNSFFNKFNEQFMMSKEIKCHAKTETVEEILNYEYCHFLNKMINQKKTQTIFFSLDRVIDLIFRTLILLISGFRIIEGSMTIGEYVIVNVYYSNVLSIVKYYFDLGQSYQTVKVSTKRMQELLNLRVERDGSKLLDSIENIKIKDLTFSHNKDKLLFCNFYYEFNKDNIYLVSGENGKGKTTLINIIISILNQDWGKVLYNDLNTSILNMHYLRKNKISIMLQDEKIPEITVKEFLFEGYRNISDKVAMEYLEKNIGYNEFSKKVLNFNKYINENMNNLSGGEKQIVMVTRCFLKESSLIIMDEPTSNMDISRTKMFFEFVDKIKKDKIIIIVSHDTNSLNEFKNIIRL